MDERWTWGPADAADRVTGPALDFCLAVTQRRHLDDVALEITGPVAAEWMSIAQAFAGPPGQGRQPGRRCPGCAVTGGGWHGDGGRPGGGIPRRQLSRRPVRHRATAPGSTGTGSAAAREMVDGGPIDVLTGDYLAELTMLILWKARQKDPDAGYARTFLTQLEQVLGSCLDRGIRIVTNAGGLNPAGLAAAAARAGRPARPGPEDRLRSRATTCSGRLDELLAAGHRLANTRHRPAAGRRPGQTGHGQRLPGRLGHHRGAGRRGGHRGLPAGHRRVAGHRARPRGGTAGPGTTTTQLAGALVAGHVIECGPQATGGNYSWLDEITDRRYPGFPIAEVAADGSAVITKHPGTGGLVSPGTVTAQLLYEIAEPAYRNPDVIAHFDTVAWPRPGRTG